MKIFEIGTGYTSIPATIGAATEIVVEELTKAFLQMGQPVEVLDIAANERGAHELPIREVKVPGIFRRTDVQLGLMHKVKRVVYSVCLAKVLKKILKKSQEPVVLHFHNQYNLFFFLKLTSKKLRQKAVIAYTNHSGIWRLPWDTVKDTIRKRYFQEATCMEQADHVFVLNEDTYLNVTQHLDVQQEKVHVICNGVNALVYHPLAKEEVHKAKQELDLADKDVFLQVGSVYENKGQLRSLQRLAPMLKAQENMVFAFVGGIVSQPYYEQVLQEAKNLGLEKQVRYLGAVSPGEELNKLYNAAHATMIASEYEGYSLVIAESLAAGVPVLMHRDCPYHIGEGCVGFEEDSFAAAAQALCADEAIRAAARKTAETCLGWKTVAQDYQKVLLKQEQSLQV